VTVYTIITLLTTIAYFGIGIFVLASSPARFLNRIFFLFCCTVALWAFGYFITLLPRVDYHTALFASRASHAVGAFIPIAFLHLTLVFLRQEIEHHRVVFLGYGFAALMFFISFTPLIVNDLLSKMNMRFYPEKGVLYIAYAALYFVFSLFYAHFYLLKAYLTAKGTYRKRLLFFAFTSLLGFTGGISLFLLIFNIPIPPYASSLIVLYPFAMALYDLSLS